MALVDSSAWIEFFRGADNATGAAVAELVRDDLLVTCGPIRLELLAGVRPGAAERKVLATLARAPILTATDASFDSAALIYRRCRDLGETVRSQIDCLIAAIAIANNVELLHNDRDFDVLARHTPLRATRG